MAFTKNQITLENRLPPGLYQALLYDDRLVFIITITPTYIFKFVQPTLIRVPLSMMSIE
jgi:hypothetical protein